MKIQLELGASGEGISEQLCPYNLSSPHAAVQSSHGFLCLESSCSLLDPFICHQDSCFSSYIRNTTSAGGSGYVIFSQGAASADRSDTFHRMQCFRASLHINSAYVHCSWPKALASFSVNAMQRICSVTAIVPLFSSHIPALIGQSLQNLSRRDHSSLHAL